MRLPLDFDHYLKKGIVRKMTPDNQKAKFLLKESETTFRGITKRIEKMGVDEDNINSVIKDCYDVMMELVRAKLLLDGFNASGLGAHEAEISYLAGLNFPEKDMVFLNELRQNRNAITYYGKLLSKEYAEKVIAFTSKMYPKLKRLSDKSL